MNERDAFLAAILAHPDEDTPRLVYADWLDEHDEPDRAELIRVQCRLALQSRYMSEAKRLAPREVKLRAKVFGHLKRLPFTNVTVRRGFVESVTSGLQVFAKCAGELRAEDAPAYELVLKPDASDDALMYERDDGYISLIKPLIEREALHRCVALDPRFYLHYDSAGCLLGSRHWSNLRRLSAGGDAGDAFEDLDSLTFSNLRWLNLHGNDDCDHHPPEIKRLAHSEHLVNLEHLDLGGCNLDDECLQDLATAPHLLHLRCLDISDSRLRGVGLTALVRTSNLPSLVELDLSDSFWWGSSVLDPDDAARQIADSPLIERLTTLALRRNEITDAGALALANSPRKLKLTRLDLWANKIGASTRRALNERFGPGVCVYKQPASRGR